MRRRRKHDPHQLKLFEEEQPTVTVKIEAAPPKKYICPFCLYQGYLHEFQIMNKKGPSRKRAKCPDCGQKMRMTTLTQKMTPSDLAKFIFDYTYAFGRYKLSWDKIKPRLKEMGIANTFWEAWKQLKNEWYKQRYGLTYEEYLEALQQQA